MANGDEQDRGFEVKDRRRFNPDGTEKEENAAAGEQPEPAGEEQVHESADTAQPRHEHAGEHSHDAEHAHDEEADQGEQMPPPNVYAMLTFVAGLLSQQAWQLMGLQMAPGQKEIIKDLAQAKLAIDTVVFIADKLQPLVDEDDRRALKTLVSDLQMNFVRQSQ